MRLEQHAVARFGRQDAAVAPKIHPAGTDAEDRQFLRLPGAVLIISGLHGRMKHDLHPAGEACVRRAAREIEKLDLFRISGSISDKGGVAAPAGPLFRVKDR